MWRETDLTLSQKADVAADRIASSCFSRRGFLKAGAAVAGGLVVACIVPPSVRKALAADPAVAKKPPASSNAFIHIAPDSTVTVLLNHSQMGQGIWTSLPMAVAEKLACDWSKVRVGRARRRRQGCTGPRLRHLPRHRQPAGELRRSRAARCAELAPAAGRQEDGLHRTRRARPVYAAQGYPAEQRQGPRRAVEHVDHDPLVLWGWNPGQNRAPVSVPHADFVAAFKRADAGGPCPS